MSSFINEQVITEFDKYYMVEGSNVKYHLQFPREWAINHLHYDEDECDGTGPEECGNCSTYGTSVTGLFVGYCGNCAFYCYEGKRGKGITYLLDYIDESKLWHDLPYMTDVYVKDLVTENQDDMEIYYREFDQEKEEQELNKEKFERLYRQLQKDEEREMEDYFSDLQQQEFQNHGYESGESDE